MRQPKFFLCTLLHNQQLHETQLSIVVDNKRGRSYLSLCSVATYYKLWEVVVPETCEVLSLRHWVEYQSNARYNDIENDYGTICEGICINICIYR